MALHPNISGNKFRDTVKVEVDNKFGDVVCSTDEFYPQKVHCASVDNAMDEITFQILFGGGLMVTRSGRFMNNEYNEPIEGVRDSLQQLTRTKQSHLVGGYKVSRRLRRRARSLKRRK